MSRGLGAASPNPPAAGVGATELAQAGGPALVGSAHGAFRLSRCPDHREAALRVGFVLRSEQR